ncbi:MAG: hypothetical protein ACKO69_09560, partial [Limnohabitans sp.]
RRRTRRHPRGNPTAATMVEFLDQRDRRFTLSVIRWREGWLRYPLASWTAPSPGEMKAKKIANHHLLAPVLPAHPPYASVLVFYWAVKIVIGLGNKT